MRCAGWRSTWSGRRRTPGIVSGTLLPSSKPVRHTVFEGADADAQAADIALASIQSLQTLSIYTPTHIHAFSIVRALLRHTYLPAVRHFRLQLCSLELHAASTPMEAPAPRCASIRIACVRAHVMQCFVRSSLPPCHRERAGVVPRRVRSGC
jgi:hypothetical protein